MSIYPPQHTPIMTKSNGRGSELVAMEVVEEKQAAALGFKRAETDGEGR